MEVQYTGESLWQGQLGHILIILSFVGAVVSLLAFLFMSLNKEALQRERWYKLGKWSFIVHVVAVLGSVALLYQLIFGHHFEYDYVRQHSSPNMAVQYLFSCFWGGQQGSFLLWIFWHAVLGTVLLFTTKKVWTGPVLATFATIQIILTTMLLGIYIPRGIALLVLFLALNLPLFYLFRQANQNGWQSIVPGWNIATILRHNFRQKKWFLTLLALPVNIFLIWFVMDITGVWALLSETIKLGVSPFVLSRNEFSDNAIFLFPDYVSRITAQGLNPLLKNYWMVIHPPTLFLGFSLTLVPLAFAISGIATQRYSDWVKPAMPWTIVATMILGLGILMGGMWAYEALSFGGFWAWDPVENASLVPWITLIAGMHTMLIFRNTGRAMKATLIFFLLSVFLVLYSTFLTRSGVLGDASVHSFTDLGMQGQLLVLILVIMLPALILYAIHWHKLPAKEKEEKISSREFWMFIASLVLLFSAIHIIFSTSLPVFNKITAGVNELLGTNFQANYALPKDQIEFYNNVQVWFGILIALFTGAAQFLKYKSTSLRKWAAKISIPALIALILTAVLEYFYQFYSFAYILLLFAGLFTIICNLEYTFTALKGNLLKSGSTIAHVGFGLLMAFIVISLGESQVISKNYLNIDFGKNFDDDFKQNNLYLLEDQTYIMDQYEVTYKGRVVEGNDYYFKVHYSKVDPETGEITDSFTLKPHILNDPNMGLVPNPSTAKFLTKDIFTHVSSIPTAGEGNRPRELPDETVKQLAIGDSFFTSRGMVRFEGMNRVENSDTAVSAVARLSVDDTRTQWEANPMFVIRGKEFITVPDTLPQQKLIFEVADIDPAAGKVAIKVTDNNDWIIMKALVFPWINMLWLGICLMMAGFLIALFNRTREYKRIKHRETS